MSETERILSSALNTLSVGILILDDTGRVTFCNSALKHMAGDGFRVDESGITLTDRQCDKALQQLLTSYMADGGEQIPLSQSLTVKRPSGKRAFAVTVRPLPPGDKNHAARAGAAMILMSDPTRVTNLISENVGALFNLSPSETRLLSALLESGELRLAAASNGVTEGSARQYLKRIFQKTKTKGQVDLITLLIGSSAP